MPLFGRARLHAKVRRMVHPSHQGTWSSGLYGAEAFRCDICGGAAVIAPETGGGNLEDMLRISCDMARAMQTAYTDVLMKDRAALILIHTEDLGGMMGEFRDLLRMVATDGGEALCTIDRAERVRDEMRKRFDSEEYPIALASWAACYDEEYEDEADESMVDRLLDLSALSGDEVERLRRFKDADRGAFEREDLGLSLEGASGAVTSIITSSAWMAARGFPYMVSITGVGMELPEFRGYPDYQSADEAAMAFREHGYEASSEATF
jgi:hypothetical protein